MSGKLLSIMACLAVSTALAGCAPAPGAAATEAGPVVVESLPEETGTPFSHAATLESGTSMRVLWTVSGYVMGKAAIWGESEAKALLFKGLDINQTQIIFDGQACSGVTFQSERVKAADYLSGSWHTTAKELGITDEQVQVVRTNCDLPGFNEYLRLDDRRLIVRINGVFFFLKSTAIQ